MGKSSLVKLLLGQEDAPAKSIYYKGDDIMKFSVTEAQAYRKNIGIVFQDYKLLDRMTVKENILYPLRLSDYTASMIDAQYNRIVDLLHLHLLSDVPVKFLSGGHKPKKLELFAAPKESPRFALAVVYGPAVAVKESEAVPRPLPVGRRVIELPVCTISPSRNHWRRGAP